MSIIDLYRSDIFAIEGVFVWETKLWLTKENQAS